MELLYATGLRIGELVLLDITSLNLVDKYVVVRAKTSKSRSDRIIPFGEVAQYWVNRYINEVRSSQYRMRVASGSSANFVFLGKGEGGMLNTRTCHLIVARQAKLAGITKRVESLAYWSSTESFDGLIHINLAASTCFNSRQSIINAIALAKSLFI